jgi:adenine phosphoribosyltransferase
VRLLELGGAHVMGAGVVLELRALGGREQLQSVPVTSLYLV